LVTGWLIGFDALAVFGVVDLAFPDAAGCFLLDLTGLPFATVRSPLAHQIKQVFAIRGGAVEEMIPEFSRHPKPGRRKSKVVRVR
jgi:hypothetical protein